MRDSVLIIAAVLTFTILVPFGAAYVAVRAVAELLQRRRERLA